LADPTRSCGNLFIPFQGRGAIVRACPTCRQLLFVAQASSLVLRRNMLAAVRESGYAGLRPRRLAMCFHRLRSLCLGVVVLYIAAGAAAAQPDDDAQTRMKDAVDRGVQYLKLHSKTGQWGGDVHQAPGLAALVGWTLLETGARPTDAEVKKVAEFVRSRSLDVTYTYSVSLAVLFLDRLGDPRDQPLIESLGARLLGGITNYAGWFYHCPAHSPQERTWVEARLKKAAQAAAVDADKAKKP